MKLKPVSAACALALIVLAQGAAHAEEGSTQLKISGYGTLAAVMTNDSQRQFIANDVTSKGATNKPDLGQDSRLGLQGVVTFQNHFSVTGQIVAKRRLAQDGQPGSDKDFSPAVDWLFAQYDATPDFNVRLGRMAIPTYLLSDSLDVGYAANWLRAPAHLYHSEAFTNADGLELNYKRSFSGFNVSAQALHGSSQAPLYTSAHTFPLSTNNLNAFNLTVEHGNWLGRVGVTRARIMFPGFGVIINDTYATAGLQYDDGQLFVVGEYAKRTQNDLTITNNKPLLGGNYSYLAAGWHFGKLVPMVMVSKDSTKTNSPIGGHVIVINQSNIAPSLVLRYDVAPNVALKAQVDRYNANDRGIFNVAVPDTHNKVNVFSAGVDFVF